jgi:gamma-glutamyl phosphate reductase
VATKQNLSSEERKKILLDIADALEANEDLIISENEADLAVAQDSGYEKSLVSRMTLKAGRVGQIHIFFISAVYIHILDYVWSYYMS